MWSKWPTSLVLSIVLSYYQVYSGGVPDVTTVYEIGKSKSKNGFESINGETYYNTTHDATLSPELPPLPPWSTPDGASCIRGVIGHVHCRTNALGMGLIGNRNNYGTNNPELPNITIDASCSYSGDICTQWSFENGSQWIGYPIDNGKKITIGEAYRIKRKITFKIDKTSSDTYIYFTRGPKDLLFEQIFFFLKIENYDYGRKRAWFYDSCINTNNYEVEFNVNRNGNHYILSCRHYVNFYEIPYHEGFVTFDFTQKGNVKMYRGIGESSTELENRNFENDLDILYFSVSPTNTEDANVIVPLIPVFKVTQEEVNSPTFTPHSEDICVSILYHSSIPSLSSELEILVLGSKNQEYSLDTIQNVKSGWNSKIVNRKLRDMSPINLKIRKTGQANINIARISSCNPEGEEVMELSQPITVCPYDRTSLSDNLDTSSLDLYSTVASNTDPVDKISDAKNKCWNGGQLTSAGCACPPGFTGPSCEIGCGANRFGQDCGGLCSLHSEECKGLLMCTEFTGCHCSPGYTGNDCTQACAPGWYGNDCSQQCAHCAGNMTCDIYTGACTSCEEGYLAPHCKLVSVYYGSKPDLTSPWYGTISVSFDPNNYVTEADPPQLYEVQFREKGLQWQVYTTKPLQRFSETSEKENKISEKIEGLKTGFVYEVRVLMMGNDLMKYDGNLVQVAEVLSKCDVPVFYDYKLTSASNITSITFSWRYTNGEYSCPLKNFEVTWKEGWKWPKINTINESFTLSGLRPGAKIKVKVRAITTGGSVSYSKTLMASTQQRVHPPVQNIHVGSSQSTSVELSWEPPIGSEGSQLRYTISYKCVDRPACSPGCQDVSEGQLTQEGTTITLSPLLPFTRYLVTVSVEGGTETSIFIGTSKVLPTEVPSLSAQRPVRTNTSVTVFWDQQPVCTGYLLGYNYQLTTASNALKIIASGFTKETNAIFHNLTASTEYVIKVFVFTVAGWNPLSYLTLNVTTSATVPEAVRNLTVYKRGRSMLGLRWAEPQATYGQLKSFTVTHRLGQEVTSHTVEPSRCVVWPDMYCHTIEGLRSNRRYNVTVATRNVEVPEDGEPATVTAITKENSPTAPVNLKLVNSTSTSVVLQWHHPDQANGVLRSFLVSIEETEKYDQENCCQVYPLVETLVKEESEKYDAEVSGLHPASSYFVSVSAKTVGLGPSQSLVAYTKPPNLPFTMLPKVTDMQDISWLPQDKLPEVNNSNIYTSLIRAHLLLVIFNEAREITTDSGITDPTLDSLLKQRIKEPFYFIAEYYQDDLDLSVSLGDDASEWGQPLISMTPGDNHQLVATQVLEYNGVFNVDLRFSQPITGV